MTNLKRNMIDTQILRFISSKLKNEFTIFKKLVKIALLSKLPHYFIYLILTPCYHVLVDISIPLSIPLSTGNVSDFQSVFLLDTECWETQVTNFISSAFCFHLKSIAFSGKSNSIWFGWLQCNAEAKQSKTFIELFQIAKRHKSI